MVVRDLGHCQAADLEVDDFLIGERGVVLVWRAIRAHLAVDFKLPRRVRIDQRKRADVLDRLLRARGDIDVPALAVFLIPMRPRADDQFVYRC